MFVWLPISIGLWPALPPKSNWFFTCWLITFVRIGKKNMGNILYVVYRNGKGQTGKHTGADKYLGSGHTGNCCIELAILCKSLPLTAAKLGNSNNQLPLSACVGENPKTTLGPTYLWLTNLHALTHHHHRSCQFIQLYIQGCASVLLCVCVGVRVLATCRLSFPFYVPSPCHKDNTRDAKSSANQFKRGRKGEGGATRTLSWMCRLKCQFACPARRKAMLSKLKVIKFKRLGFQSHHLAGSIDY